jgi:RecA-family ATPase
MNNHSPHLVPLEELDADAFDTAGSIIYDDAPLLDEPDDLPPPPGAATLTTTPKQNESRAPIELEIVNATSLAERAVPRQRWHVPDLIPSADVTILSADGSTGKSLLAEQLAVATADASEWIGTMPEPGKVIFLSAEDELDEFHRRLDKITPNIGALHDLLIVPLAGKDAVLAAPAGREGLLQPTALFAALCALVEKHKPILLILDTLADLFGGDEIKKVHARQFIGMLRGLAIRNGVTILLLSHPSQSGMASGSGTSGNTAWNNSVRSRLYLERRKNQDGSEDDTDIRILTTKKANRAKHGGKIFLRYSDGKFVRENVAAQTGDAERKAERVFLTLLAQFEREGRSVSHKPSQTYAPALFAQHPDAERITKPHFAKAMDRLFAISRIKLEEHGPPSRRYQKIVSTEKFGEEGGRE